MARGLRAGLGAAIVCVGLILDTRAQPASAADFDCAGFLRMHGMLRRASTACGYTAYNPAIVERARACFDTLGSVRGAEAMHSGAAEFERLKAVRNHDALCESVAARFQMVVQP